MTGVWWDTGASVTTAAGPVTAQGAATLSQETASAGECACLFVSWICLSDSFGDLIVIWKTLHAIGGAKMSFAHLFKEFCCRILLQSQVLCSCKILEMN